MSESVAVAARLELPSIEVLEQWRKAALVDAPPSLLDEVWGEDFGDPPTKKTVRVALQQLAKELRVSVEGTTVELSGMVPWDTFRDLGRTLAAVVWLAHGAGARGVFELAADGIALGGRIELAGWKVDPTAPSDLFERLAPIPTAQAPLAPATEVTVDELFARITPTPTFYPCYSAPVREAVDELTKRRDPRITELALARIPKTLDAYHGPKAVFVSDLVRILGAQGGAAAMKKIESLRARVAPKPRQPPGLIRKTCDEVLGRSSR